MQKSSIDLVRTKWRDAISLLQGDGQIGHLVVRQDGTFSFKQMPDFSRAGFCQPPTLNHSGSGAWWTNFSNIGEAYLWLDIEKMDGQQQQKESIAHFFRDGDKYFLYFTVVDPDSDEVFVMKRVEKKGIKDGDATDEKKGIRNANGVGNL